MVKGEDYIGIINLPNHGQISNLPKDVVVETHGVINSTGAYALTIGEVPAGVQNILLKHILNQEITIQSALQGDDQFALQVLLNDPLSGRLTVEQARQMLAELLEANKQYLPKFF
jgi:alpha-galactosidase